jgi:hypothetical protein
MPPAAPPPPGQTAQMLALGIALVRDVSFLIDTGVRDVIFLIETGVQEASDLLIEQQVH